MKKIHIKILFLFLCIGIFILSKNSFAKETEQPYELSVQISQNAGNIADVAIDIDVVQKGYSAPATAKQIKLKSSSGTTQYKDVALTPKTDGSGSSVVLQYENTANAESIQVTVKIKNEKGNTKLTTTEEVLLLPDLAVSEIDIEDTVVENQETTITAKISELNGDMEASADVSLLIGETEIGSSTVTVKPGKSEDVDFETTFETNGSFSVTVRIDNVRPEDFDQTNNILSSTAEVYTIPEALALNDDLNYIFDIDSLPSITVEISTDEWNNQLLFYDANPQHEENSKAGFYFTKNNDTEQLDEIGFRIRGHDFSRMRPEGVEGELHNPDSPDWHLAHFKIDFTEYDNKQRFHGVRSINLKYFKDDETYVREIYCYDLFKKFDVWTAPFASYVRLFIKIKEDDEPAYYGVYKMIENIDVEFIQDRFGKKNDTGNLWKQSNGNADLTSYNLDTETIGIEDVSLLEELSFRPTYDLKTNRSDLENAREQLVQFVENLNTKTGDEFADWIQSVMDIDLFLKSYAVGVLVGAWDDYWINANNYYLYFDSEGKVFFIPYDFDATLGISYYLDNTGTQDVMKWGAMNNSRPLIYKILSVSQFRDQYKAYIQELLNEENDYFDYDNSTARITAWQAMISDYIENDTGEIMEIADVPPDWGNAPFYRLLTGDDSGAEPEANWFKTRTTFATEHISDDEGWTSAVEPITAELYLVGDFNNWEISDEYKFYDNDSIYTLETDLSIEEYTLRIVDRSWNEVTDFGASRNNHRVTIDESLRVYSRFSDPVSRDITLTTYESGTYRFEFDTTDSANPTLLVTKPSYLYLRGDFNNWEAVEDYKFTSDNGESTLEVSLTTGSYDFRIADQSWSEDTNYGAPAGSNKVTLGEPLQVYSISSSPSGSENIVIDINVSGKYRFELDTTDNAHQTLLVTLVEIEYTDLYLRGNVNNWEAVEEYKFTVNNGIYTLDVALSADTHKFRIADESWNEATNYGALAGSNNVTLGEPLQVYSISSSPSGSENIVVDIAVSGTYRFELDITDAGNLTLLVTQVD
ncbi:MAG: hypothetical protein FJ264_16280 [Planctomycetes bacterium]|nr:hypothetical protein [Planctomycetota bacterium]